MTDHARDLELLGSLDVEGGIETHLQIAVDILVEDSLETLFEDGGGERIGDDHEPVGVVAQTLHLE